MGMGEGVSLMSLKFSPGRKCLRNSSYLFAAGLLVAIGWQGHGWYYKNVGMQTQRRVRQKGYRYTSPLLDVELPEGVSVRFEPIPFKYKIKSYVEYLEKSGRAKHVSVYFRDLNDGPWFGIDEKREYAAASMMKVPVMIAWLKRAEKDPSVLGHVYVYDGSRDRSGDQQIKPAATLSRGVGYTVEELLHYMLNYSDNNATAILYENLRPEELADVLGNMDVTNNPHGDSNYISLHGYSGFFRILYNAAYLSRDMSEKALKLLSLQDFPQGIAAGVPGNVPVAAKFGESAAGPGGEDKQLHEFGIVYHPSGPYILGIMTLGEDLASQAEIIRNISAMVYAEVGKSIVTGAHQ